MKINTHQYRPADYEIGQTRKVSIDELIAVYQGLHLPIPLHIMVEAIGDCGFILEETYKKKD